MASWNEATAIAAATPPASLSGFSLEAQPPAGDGAFWVEFRLSCKACGGSTFWFYSFPTIAPDPSPYFDVSPGETIQRPPHSAECSSCGARRTVFDARTDGYDGILCGGCSYESGDFGEARLPTTFALSVAVIYNIEASELRELATGAQVQPSDLFDAITISGVAPDGSASFEEAYECA